jgi:hypothetical protein
MPSSFEFEKVDDDEAPMLYKEIDLKYPSTELKFTHFPSSERALERDAAKEKKLNDAAQLRPRTHQREMQLEEAMQRKVTNQTVARRNANAWLIQRAGEGRLMLLKKGRLVGIDKEARMLWKGKSCTVGGGYVKNERGIAEYKEP